MLVVGESLRQTLVLKKENRSYNHVTSHNGSELLQKKKMGIVASQLYLVLISFSFLC